MTETLPLLPLVKLPHHALFSGHAFVCGHAEVAETVVSVLVVTGQVAGHRGRAGRGATNTLRERLVRLGHDQLGLEGRSTSGEGVLRDRMARKRNITYYTGKEFFFYLALNWILFLFLFFFCNTKNAQCSSFSFKEK